MIFPQTFVYNTKMGKIEQVVTNIDDYNHMVGWLGNKLGPRDGKWYIKEERQRSLKQNSSGHLFFTQIADTLNDAGIEQKLVLEKVAYDIPNTMESIKGIFKSFSKAMFNKESTKELTTKEFSEVAEVMTKELGEKLKIELPDYPSIESLAMKDRINE